MAGVFLPTTRSFIISNETNRKSETSGKKADSILAINFKLDKQMSRKMFTLYFALLKNKIILFRLKQILRHCQIMSQIADILLQQIFLSL